MIRKIYTFFFGWMELKVWALLWWDLLLLTQNQEDAVMKILLEYNEVIPQLSAEEVQEILVTISASGETDKKGKKQTVEELVLMETFVMVHTHQRIEDIRGRTIQYFFLVSRCIGAALGHKKADEVINPDGVDREGVRDLTGGKKEVVM